MFPLFKKVHIAFLLFILLIVSNAIGWCNVDKTTDGRVVSTDVVSEVPFEIFGQNIFIKVKINNNPKEYTFIFDTGSSSVIISKEVASELGNFKMSTETIINDAVDASQKAKEIRLKSLNVCNTKVENCKVIVVDLSIFKTFGIKVDGILGNNFLKFFQVKIDYEKKLLTLSSNPDIILKSNQGYKVKLFFQEGLISTQLQVGPTDSSNSWLIQRAIIDTGASGDEYLHLPFNCMERIKLELNSNLIKSIGFGGGGLFGESEAIYSRLSTMELGGLKVNNIPIQFSLGKRIYITNKFLSHFIVMINYPKSEMFLLPYENKPFKTNVNSFGFIAKKDGNGKIKIVGLWEGSSAEKNGLKIGDEIITCSVNEISNVKYEDLIPYLFSEQDIILRLQIVNKSGQREVTLKKTNLLSEI